MSQTLHVGTRKGLFTLVKKRGRWTIDRADFLGVSVPAVLSDPRPRHGALYAALGHGHFGLKMHRSADGGKTWTEVAAPEYPPKPDDAPVWRDAYRGIEIPWRLEMVWSLEVDPRKDGALWCGTLPGGLFHSEDRGATWKLNRALWDHPDRLRWMGGGYEYAGIHSICIDPRKSDTLRVGISSGGVWETTDGGKSWRVCSHGMKNTYMPPELAADPVTQDPHRVVQSPVNPDVLWCQHHEGIYRSADSSQSWQPIQKAGPSVFGFTVAAHPRKADTAWFVPGVKDENRTAPNARVVVTRTDDGGRSFQVLSKGLPGEHAYDLVYRHALDVDDTGEQLAFGSTTGNFWTSSDGGESWQTVSNHLPPVYTVRFVKPA